MSITIRRALLSVSDKTGLIDFAKALAVAGVTLISTGGTRKTLLEAGLTVTDISEVTGFPEILDGRVKTLHPHVHGGILAIHDHPEHQQTLKQQGIEPIELIVCNLYPFEQTVEEGGTPDEIIENIDIGGPTMVRAAAKNYQSVAVVTKPSQYAEVLEEFKQSKSLSLETRRQLAIAAFARTAKYDQAISSWFSRQKDSTFPKQLSLQFIRKGDELRYGENPHQKAAFYVESTLTSASVASAEVLHGKELSYNNLLDLDSALNLVREFDAPAAVVIKHNNPCGVAFASTLSEAFQLAYEGDTLSAFGGILGFNRELDEETARHITEPNRFIECIIAPSFSESALNMLTTRPTWKKSVRLLQVGPLSRIDSGLDFRRIHQGLLVQDRDLSNESDKELEIVSERKPTEEELRDLHFAWIVAKHVKSNAIVLAKGGAVMGVGAGQMSRIDSLHLAALKAGERAKGTVLASDAFFPFRDNIDAAAEFGVTAVIQPGGAKRDQDSIDACNENGLAMVLTRTRHFRH